MQSDRENHEIKSLENIYQYHNIQLPIINISDSITIILDTCTILFSSLIQRGGEQAKEKIKVGMAVCKVQKSS